MAAARRKVKNLSDRRYIARCAEALLLDRNNDPYWDIISQLRWFARASALPTIFAMSEDRDWKARVFAADVLGEFGIPKRLAQSQCRKRLSAMLETEKNPVVLESVIRSLDFQDCVRPHLPRLHALAKHRYAPVRHVVAIAIGSINTPANNAALLGLMRDRSVDARDWATFGVGTGSIQRLRTDLFRNALLHALSDRSLNVRAEAAYGLARLRDRRAIPTLLHLMKVAVPNFFLIEAFRNAKEIELLPTMRRYERRLERSPHHDDQRLLPDLREVISMLESRPKKKGTRGSAGER